MTTNIRNFSIIAHIDHGKSTLADRILDLTHAVEDRNKVSQILDDMDIERERGITVKSRSVCLSYKSLDGEIYQLNLIDTPGHVDFSYEVSRSLAACEGALLVVDASQGVQAQTVAHVNKAIDNKLEIIPVINKIDLPTSNVEQAKEEIEDLLSIDASDAILVSAKTGLGVVDVLEAIIKRVPCPKSSNGNLHRSLIFDSWFDSYNGVTLQIRVVEGKVSVGDRIRLIQSKAEYQVTGLGVFNPYPVKVKFLSEGNVGFLTASIKNISDAKVGDTITSVSNPASDPLPGFEEIKPFVFSGLYPSDPNQFEMLREALSKLKLNDSAFTFEPESSVALGFGFRCGYLGLLHMEIVQERLEREFNINLVTTAPAVAYKVKLNSGQDIMVDNPARMPDSGKYLELYEPMIRGTIHTLHEFVGPVISLCEDKRGRQESLEYYSGNRVRIIYILPLSEIVIDFYDKLKSLSKGYSSFDYEFQGYEKSNLVRLDLRVNNELVDGLTMVVHKDKAYSFGQKLTSKMKELIDPHMFEVIIQASACGRIIARSTVKALRKNVTAKCYGGDITRKRKLLEKQKEGKKRMKQVGSVNISQDAFLAALKIDKS